MGAHSLGGDGNTSQLHRALQLPYTTPPALFWVQFGQDWAITPGALGCS